MTDWLLRRVTEPRWRRRARRLRRDRRCERWAWTCHWPNFQSLRGTCSNAVEVDAWLRKLHRSLRHELWRGTRSPTPILKLAINCMMQAKIHPGSFAGMDRGVIHYFTRLHTDSALVPVEVAGFVLRNSLSSIDVMTRLPSVPTNLANELPSNFTMMVLFASSTV